MEGGGKRSDTPSTSLDLGVLYREHRAAVLAYVRRSFGDGPPSAEEIAQDAFVRLAQHEHRDAIPNPRAFLLLTARNLAIDAQRRTRREAAVLRSASILSEQREAVDAATDLTARQELERLAAIIDTLKPKERAVFLMHRVDELSFSEIGRRLRISASGARLLAGKAFAACAIRMQKPITLEPAPLTRMSKGDSGGQRRDTSAPLAADAR